MAKLTDLSTELLNYICRLCLISPTGAIQPVSRREGYRLGYLRSASPSGPHFYLTVASLGPYDLYTYQDRVAGHPAPPLNEDEDAEENNFISTSLIRVNKAIHQAASPIFWQNNTFHFSTPWSFMAISKLMGPVPSRKINSIRLPLPGDMGTVHAQIYQAMRCLSRLPSLQRLELLMDDSLVDDIIVKRDNLPPVIRAFALTAPRHTQMAFSSMLRALENVREGDFESRIVLKAECSTFHRDSSEVAMFNWLSRYDKFTSVLDDMSYVSGGKVLWNEVLLFKNGLCIVAKEELKESPAELISL